MIAILKDNITGKIASQINVNKKYTRYVKNHSIIEKSGTISPGKDNPGSLGIPVVNLDLGVSWHPQIKGPSTLFSAPEGVR